MYAAIGVVRASSTINLKPGSPRTFVISCASKKPPVVPRGNTARANWVTVIWELSMWQCPSRKPGAM